MRSVSDMAISAVEALVEHETVPAILNLPESDSFFFLLLYTIDQSSVLGGHIITAKTLHDCG